MRPCAKHRRHRRLTRYTEPSAPISLIEFSPDGFLSWPGHRVRCALGKTGLTNDKREGDGATPIGNFPLRTLWYRDDRVDPITQLSRFKIQPADGWCDDPADPAYNQPVKLPYSGRHEHLYRLDHLYDLVVPLGYNDAPVVAGRGSAIFLHVAKPDYAPTEGCLAIAPDDLLALLPGCSSETMVRIAG